MIHEVTVDEEDLPDVDDEEHSDFENMSVDGMCSILIPLLSALLCFGIEYFKFFPNLIRKDHGDSVSSLALSFDGQLLASRGFDGVVWIWGPLGTLIHRLDGPGGGIEVYNFTISKILACLLSLVLKVKQSVLALMMQP
ncbi:hypothetical protein SLEP1_g40989 [Rubroshorea leprosula]|uniref:Uncharacterized protein n=1 Tax=Rubroshorea leprosula TaxID=152421 RepID=A0AAV5L571_9ROSI|nr:hypothetical protein SLEP1_g40989 [Rubroshorea leprosula]